MSEDELFRAFEPYYTPKGSQGSGLGLAMSREIAQRHDGDIVGRSEPEVGTHFVLELPVSVA